MVGALDAEGNRTTTRGCIGFLLAMVVASPVTTVATARCLAVARGDASVADELD